MAAVLKVYESAVHEAFNGAVHLDSANNLKMILMTAYTYDETDATYTTIKTDHTEHATANGYTVGGVVVGSVTHVINPAGVVTFGSASVVWTATGALTAKYAVAYDVASDAALFCIDLDGAGGDVTATDAAFTITDASGWFSIDVSP